MSAQPVRATDAELISAAASGDSAAYMMLTERHGPAARDLAGHLCADPAEAGAIVSEAFARTHGTIRDGGGPREALRPYLLGVVRQVARPEAVYPGFAGPSGSLLGRAYMSLPEWWRAAAWLTAIEQSSAEETAAILGLATDDVAEVSGQALSALAEAYLGLYLSGVTRGDCKSTSGALGVSSDGTLSGPDEWAERHLRSCPGCRAMVAELGDLSRSLRRAVAPVFLGPAATAYLSASGRNAVPDGQEPGRGDPMRQPLHQGSQAPRRRSVLTAGAALLAVLAITGLALALAGRAGPAHAGQRPVAEIPASSAAPAGSASPVPARARPAASSTRPPSGGTPAASPSAASATPGPTTSAPTTPAPTPTPSASSPAPVPTFPFPCPTDRICPM